MHPSSYWQDGSGRDMFVKHSEGRTAGKLNYFSATDSMVFKPWGEPRGLEHDRMTIHSAWKRSEGPPKVLPSTPRSKASQTGPNPWSSNTYRTTYRDHHGAIGSEDYARHEASANAVRNILASPRLQASSKQVLSNSAAPE
mmetsp:Transcript_48765/g.91308  ORF Transcript_48765/g.91308 Transcript_48765/m.91308 type:complete len:141 (-) Transcript_48765:18-440(-)